MADESNGPIEGSVQSLKPTASGGGGPSMAGDSSYPIAALIAQKLRDCGVGCEIVHPVPTGAAVLRRDRVVIVLAVALLSASAWGYLFWLSADMDMGGMDMTGLRMIPSGMGLMMPTDTPWRAMEFAFVFAMWTVMMVGMPEAIRVRDKSWRLSPHRTGLLSTRFSPWRLLCWLLLGPDGAVTRGRCYERALDRPASINGPD